MHRLVRNWRVAVRLPGFVLNMLVGIALGVLACDSGRVVAPVNPSADNVRPALGMVDPCANLPDEPPGLDYEVSVEVCYAIQGIGYGGICDDMYNYLWDALTGGRIRSDGNTALYGLYYGSITSPLDPNATITFSTGIGDWRDNVATTARHEFGHAYSVPDTTEATADSFMATCWP
jgi:hypothetical protein